MSARQDRAELAKTGGGLFYRLRMALLAWDRWAMTLPLHRKAGNGGNGAQPEGSVGGPPRRS